MTGVALAFLCAGALIGAYLLVPRGRARFSRRVIAITHGGLGALGLAILGFALRDGVPRALAGRPVATAFGLLALGFLGGLAVFAATRHKKSPPALALALHVILAGIGVLLYAGLVLT